MTVRVVRESYDGSSISVDVMKVMGRLYVSVNTHEFDTDVDAVEVDRDTLVYLTAAETAELVEALNAKLAELATPDSRPSASPVAEGRAQTAPVGAGAAPTGETSNPTLADDPDGNTRTQATGPSTPTAGPGRPTCDDCAPFLCVCGAVPGDELFVTGAEPPDVADPPGNPSVCEHGYRFENALCPVTTCGASAYVEPEHPATSILSGLSIAEITAARLAADPASADVPFEAGGALHVVERCGCNDCEDAFGAICRAREAENDAALDAARREADEQAKVERELEADERAGIAWALADARAELLAHSTHIGPAGGEDR